MRRFLFLLVLALSVAAAAAAHLLQPGMAKTLRYAVFDQYQRWFPRPPSAVPDVVVVDIDDESLSRLGQWPWPRTRFAVLQRRLAEAGAVAVGFDILFAERDRSSPTVLARDLALPGALARELDALPDHDEVFAASLGAPPAVLGFAVDRENGGGTTGVKWPFRIVTRGVDALPVTAQAHAAVMPLPGLAAAAAGLGSISFAADGDGVVRRVPMVMRLADGWVPALDAELLRLAGGGHNLVLEGEGGQLAALRVGARRVPVTPAGEAWLHYAAAPEQPFLPAWRVLSADAPLASLQGRIVLVGSSAKGLLDLRFSPLGEVVPGIEIHAQALRQALAGRFPVRPQWAEAFELLMLLAGSLGGVLVALRLAALPAALLAGGAALAMLGAGAAAFAGGRLLLDPALPVLATLVASVMAGLVRYRRQESRQRWLRQAFARYLSPNLVDYLVRHPQALKLGGERCVCSFVFTDLAGYTRLIESLAPERAVGLLNDYLEGMVAIAFRHQGTLDRIVGDAVAVLFSAPLAQPDHARRALACALEMHAFSERYAEGVRAQGVAFGHTRIGVHSGEVIVGNFGGQTMFDYRALGDPVNTAARLESANKWLGTRICISAAVREACPDVAARAVGTVRLQGKNSALAVFEPLPGAGQPDSAYDAAFDLLDRAPDAAQAAFAHLAAERPADGLVAFHLQRLRAGHRGTLIEMGYK